MKRGNKDKKSFLFFASWVLLASVVFMACRYVPNMVKDALRRMHNPRQGTSIECDMAELSFQTYSGYVSASQSIELTIRSTIEEYEITVDSDPGRAPGTAKFLVAPKQYQFSTADIAGLVRDGLESFGPDGTLLADDLWKSYSISTNKDSRTWTVSLSGVSGEGSIRMHIGDASAEFPVSRPKLFPIWKVVQYVDKKKGIVVLGGHEFRCGHVIAPDLSNNTCGYRIHSITNKSVWFEAVYDRPNPALSRKLWPDLRIDFRTLDNGQSFSTVVFEGGLRMSPGDKATFNDINDSLLLDPVGILSEQAVLFRYLDALQNRVADMICVTL